MSRSRAIYCILIIIFIYGFIRPRIYCTSRMGTFMIFQVLFCPFWSPGAISLYRRVNVFHNFLLEKVDLEQHKGDDKMSLF